jgi:hypothetical protein
MDSFEFARTSDSQTEAPEKIPRLGTKKIEPLENYQSLWLRQYSPIFSFRASDFPEALPPDDKCTSKRESEAKSVTLQQIWAKPPIRGRPRRALRSQHI